MPSTPDLRRAAGEPAATTVTSMIGATHKVAFRNLRGTTVIRAPVVGYYLPNQTPLPAVLVASGNTLSITRTFTTVDIAGRQLPPNSGRADRYRPAPPADAYTSR